MAEDPLSPIFKKPFDEVIHRLDELLSQSGRAFLLGAGCSKCASLPLTAELTEKVLADGELDGGASAILQAIKDEFEGAEPPAHIEDYLSELVDLTAIASRRQSRNAASQTVSIGGNDYTEPELLSAIEHIKKAVADIIGASVNIHTHKRFVSAVNQHSARPGKYSQAQSVDYLILNYDTLVEDSLALAQIPFSDGMEGGVCAWWNPDTFERSDLGARVYKLHGSIDWYEIAGSTLPQRVPMRIEPSDIGQQRILIWPASTKYRETQLDPYAQLADRARRVLNPQRGTQRVLVICGYSFGDSHINIEIERGLKASSGDLTVIAFTNEDEPAGKLKEWHEDESITEQVLIFANKGFFHGRDVRRSDDPLLWWQFEHITSILEGKK
ncbi:hypothetical protein GCM10007891_19440 [Methylophaga thalassica]|uniref:SIR2-like domain-containing protein n=1 Tax=Methylophaga thalassica TaxID=40223 RepID=A0ABQ5TWC0_9GAMM|nr:SIR2 family protein [Methylophaga thalassica]GLQ00091.1 hypothetical protein GCM10007891_19440 [Methylophaga thalassica]